MLAACAAPAVGWAGCVPVGMSFGDMAQFIADNSDFGTVEISARYGPEASDPWGDQWTEDELSSMAERRASPLVINMIRLPQS